MSGRTGGGGGGAPPRHLGPHRRRSSRRASPPRSPSSPSRNLRCHRHSPRRRRHRDLGSVGWCVVPDSSGRRVGSDVGIARGHCRTTSRSSPDGSLLVATGNKGKIYRLVWRSLAADAGCARQRAAGHEPPARARGPRHRRHVESGTSAQARRPRAPIAARIPPMSAMRRPSRCGARIKWQEGASGGRVEISTRSGNTRTPRTRRGATGASPYTDRDGSPITSPRARYLQWRAVLIAGKGESPF